MVGDVSFTDLIDGGGPGRQGLYFEGPFLISKGLNFFGLKPRGYKDLVKQYRAGSSQGVNQQVDRLMAQGMNYRDALAATVGQGFQGVSNADRTNIVGDLASRGIETTNNTSVDALAQLEEYYQKNPPRSNDCLLYTSPSPRDS